jgi:hypothetical protein
MTDSVALFPLGYRFEDPQGVPYSGATVEFYDEGTTNHKTVYADKDLTVELGTSIITDAAGRPTSDGTTPTDVFVGTAPYKYILKDSDGVVIETKDNRPGAVVSASSVDVAVTAKFPVATKSLDYAVVAADQNSTFLINCSSADVTLTLPSATDDDIPNGWKIKVQHAGSANQAIVVVKSGSGQNIYEGTKTYGGSSFVLALNGEDCEVISDGGNWRVVAHTAPFLKMAQGVIPITDQVSTSPASPQAGALYLLTGVGGDFSTFTAGDIAMYTGAGWVNFTPQEGWVAFVADEDRTYQYFGSAWVAQPLSTPAAQATMESANAGTPVTADMQQYHPGHPKCWAKATGGTAALVASYNITSTSDGGTGVVTFNIATDFSSADWSCCFGRYSGVTGATITDIANPASGSIQMKARIATASDSNGDLIDPAAWFMAGLGDQ